MTGVALEKHNQTFHWKIAEATLLRNGEVQSDIYNWLPVNEFNLTDTHDAYDYHTLSWENRSIVLGTVMAPLGSAITGIRFKTYSGRLHVEIQATKFDFRSGKLYDHFEWISTADGQEHQPNYINLEDSDLPEKNPNFSIPVWQIRNSFVEFQPTDRTKDASQSVIPYIDTQLVEPLHVSPLAGIGIYYKGNIGFGGYIAPHIITYDYLQHITKSEKIEN